MRKAKRGVTLVEVLVSIAVFSILSLALFSSVFAMKNVIKRQEEYVKIDMVCYDMDAYYEKYDNEWASEYFVTNDGVGYLSSDFKPTTEDNAAYVVKFEENVIKSISTIDSKIVFVENVTLSK